MPNKDKVIEINIHGVVSANNITEHIFIDKFIEWIESNNWHFGGSIKDITDKE